MSIKQVTEKESQLANMLTACSETLKQVTAERDKLAGELKALRDSGIELPEPETRGWNYGPQKYEDCYFEPQLRDYGNRRAMAERERCAKVCEVTPFAWDGAAAIRKGEKS